MNRTLNFIKNLVIILYILVIIFVTICLLSYNDYKVAEIGNYTLIPIIDEELSYDVGDLLLIKKADLATVKINNDVFFYRRYAGEQTINLAKVVGVEHVSEDEITITVPNDIMFSSDELIGKTDDVEVIPHVGKILSILESKWGFLFLGVFPSLIAFLYTLYSIVIEIKENKEAEERKRRKAAKKKKAAAKAKKEEAEKSEETKKEKTEEISEEKTEDKKEENVEKQTEEKSEKVEETAEKENKEEVKEVKQEVVEEKTEEKVEEVKKEGTNSEEKTSTTEDDKKAKIEEKMKSMTEEQKRALIEAKLKSMTPEEKKALLERKRKKDLENK